MNLTTTAYLIRYQKRQENYILYLMASINKFNNETMINDCYILFLI